MKPDTEDKRREAAISLTTAGKYKQFEFYEGAFTDKFVKACPNKVVVDCGMCYGYYTALALRAGCIQVHGFEPDVERHRKHLQKFFGKSPKVYIHFKALSNHTGELKLFSRPGTLRSWSSTPSIARARGNPKKRKLVPVEVECTTIDASVSEPVGVIKCDTEGAETTIFYGAKNTLCEHHPTIFLELHKIGEKKTAELQDFLRSCGYNATFHGHGRYVLGAK